MTKILVATDFSADSINALEHALVWAHKLQAHLRLYHVVKSSKFDLPGFNPGNQDQALEVAKEAMKVLFQEYVNSYQVPDKTFDFKVEEGKVYHQIVEEAIGFDASVVVMGTHGTSGFEEYFAGSNSFRVVSRASKPVLTIRLGFPKGAPKTIVLPIDVTTQTRQKVPLVAELAHLFEAKVHIMGVRETDTPEVIYKVNQYVDQVVEYLEARSIEHDWEVRKGGNITKITIEFAKEKDADLICIMTEQTERPENLWLGTYAQQMINQSPIPVLSLQPQNLTDPNRV